MGLQRWSLHPPATAAARAFHEGPFRMIRALAVLVAAAFLALVGVPAGHAYVFERTDSGVPIFWPGLRETPAQPVKFTYSAQGSARLGGPLPGNPALRGALDDAFTRWTQVPTATVRLATPDVTNTTALGNDGVNLVVFTSMNDLDFTGPDGPYIVGLTTTSYMPSTGVLVDADLQFNDTSAWFRLSLSGRTGQGVPGAPGATYIRLADVATHEMGHALGLDHSGVKNTCMFFAASDGGTNLGPDDVAGISSLYPSSEFATTTGALAGQVTGNGPVFGAHVVAVSCSTGQPAVAALTQPDGSFEMEGVPPGRYVLVAEPFRPNALGYYYSGAATSFPMGVYSPSITADPTVVTVSPAHRTAGLQIRVDQPRIDPPGAGTPQSALSLGVRQTVSRHLPPGSYTRPSDYYSFEATRGSTLTFNVTSHRLWIPTNPKLEILDSDLTVLSGPSRDLAPLSPYDLDDRLEFAPPHQGTHRYYLRLTAQLADSSTFPDSRAIKESESLYLLSMEQVRSNTGPVVLVSADQTHFTTTEASATVSRELSVPLTAWATDSQDRFEDLTWTAVNVPDALLAVDGSALGRSPATLRIVPRAHRSGSATFDLVVADRDGASATVPVRVTIVAVDDPPTVRATLGGGVVSGSPRVVTLDATGSRAGPEGDDAELTQGLAYAWTQLSGPSPQAILGGSDATVRIVAREAGVYRFRGTVTQVGGAAATTAATDLEFSVTNVPPELVVVAPRVAVPGQSLSIRADLSVDANEDLPASAYSLEATSPATATTSVVVSATSTGGFRVTLPGQPGTFRFRLAARDTGFREADGSRTSPLTTSTELTIVAGPPESLPPSADAGPDQVVRPGIPVVLDGRESRSMTGAGVAFLWTPDPLFSRGHVLSSSTAPSPNFYGPSEGAYSTFELLTRIGSGGGEPGRARVAVHVVPDGGTNRFAPVARARLLGLDAAAAYAVADVGARLVLDGTDSMDPEGASFDLTWSQVEGPLAPLSSIHGSTPSFAAPARGTYRFRLTAHDGIWPSRPSDVVVRVGPEGFAAARIQVSARQPARPGTERGPDQELRFEVEGTGQERDRIEFIAALEGPVPADLFLFEQIAGPPTPVVEGTDGRSLSFIPRTTAVHGFRIHVRDTAGVRHARDVYFAVDSGAARVPRARLGSPSVTAVQIGEVATLDGSASVEVLGSGNGVPSTNLVYQWIQVDGPPVPLTDAQTARPTLHPPSAGRYAWQLAVTAQDTGVRSAPSDFVQELRVNPAPAVPGAVTTQANGSAAAAPALKGAGGCAMGDPQGPLDSGVPLCLALVWGGLLWMVRRGVAITCPR